MELYYLILLSGWIGFFFSLCSSFSKKGRSVIFYTIPSSFFWACHYTLLEGIGGAIICFLGVFRNISSLSLPFKYSKYVVIITFLLSAVLTVMYSNNYYDLLALAGLVFISFSVLFPDKDLQVKGSSICARLLFLLNGVALQSIPAVLVEVCCIAGLVYSILKYDMPKVSSVEGDVRVRA